MTSCLHIVLSNKIIKIATDLITPFSTLTHLHVIAYQLVITYYVLTCVFKGVQGWSYLDKYIFPGLTIIFLFKCTSPVLCPEMVYVCYVI